MTRVARVISKERSIYRSRIWKTDCNGDYCVSNVTTGDNVIISGSNGMDLTTCTCATGSKASTTALTVGTLKPPFYHAIMCNTLNDAWYLFDIFSARAQHHHRESQRGQNGTDSTPTKLVVPLTVLATFRWKRTKKHVKTVHQQQPPTTTRTKHPLQLMRIWTETRISSSPRRTSNGWEQIALLQSERRRQFHQSWRSSPHRRDDELAGGISSRQEGRRER